MGVELLYTGIIGFARTLFKVQGLDITTRGEHHFPAKGGAVVVINHTGYFDFVAGVDLIVAGETSGLGQPSTLRDARTGARLR